jgi:hypothetical protein
MRKLFPLTLHLFTSIYGLSFLMLFVMSFIPSTISSVSESDNPYDLQNIIFKLLFVVVLVGYLISWRREGMGGLIFVLWWVAVWCYGKFIIAPLYGSGTDAMVMGSPVLILGILFIVSWYNKKRVRTDFAPSVGTDSQKPPKS